MVASFWVRNKPLTRPRSSSRQAIKKYVISNNKITYASQRAFDAQFNKAIKAGVEKGDFTQPKGKFNVPCPCLCTGLLRQSTALP